MKPIITLVALLLALSPSLAQADTESEAYDVYMDAVALSEAGRYEEAIPLFVQSLALGAPEVALYNLGRCYEEMGDYKNAALYFQQYLDSAAAEDVAEVKARLDKLESAPSTVSLVSIPAEASVVELLEEGESVALGITPIEFSAELGDHVFLVSKNGYEEEIVRLKTSHGQRYELEIALKPTPEGEGPADRPDPDGPGVGSKAHPNLGLYLDVGGGASLHVYKTPGTSVGGCAILGIGWRFGHGSATGFALGVRGAIRPYTLEGSQSGEGFEQLALFTSFLAVPAFQFRLTERLGLEASVPVGFAMLIPTDKLSRDMEVRLLGGTIDGSWIPLLDLGVGLSLRIMLVSGLYLAVEPVRFRLLVPLGDWLSDNKVLTDLEFGGRIGFEF